MRNLAYLKHTTMARDPLIPMRSRHASVIALLLLSTTGARATDAPEHIAWQRAPIAVALGVGVERRVVFPEAITIGVPQALQERLRVQSIAGTLYLLAHEPFTATRVLVRGAEHGQVYVLDLTATTEGAGDAPIEIHLPEVGNRDEDAAAPSAPSRYGYVALTRFAAQQLYAPARLLHELPGVVRAPVTPAPVALVRGDAIEAVPLIAWRAGDRHVTAVRLTNQTRDPQVLDPRKLRGQWLAATFQHNRLLPAGSEADRTVVYLISDRPFAAALP